MVILIWSILRVEEFYFRIYCFLLKISLFLSFLLVNDVFIILVVLVVLFIWKGRLILFF